AHSGQLNQVHDRAHGQRRRRDRGRDLDPRDSKQLYSAHDQLPAPRPGLRSRLRAQSRPTAERAHRGLEFLRFRRLERQPDLARLRTLMPNRVAITGLGLVSPLGNAPAALWQALAEGRSGVGTLEHLGLEAYRTKIGGAVRDFQPRQFISDPKTLKLMTRPVRLGVAALELAVRDAQWGDNPPGTPPAGLNPARIASFVGSPGHAGDRDELLRALDLSYGDQGLDLRAFGGDGISTINPLWLLKSLANLVLYFVSMRLGAQGPNANICMSGTGGLMAVGEAFHCIRHGRADVALAGGYESLLDEERLESFEPSGLLYLGNGAAAAASRPFDRGHAGFVAAEGGAFVVLEELGRARARGARTAATGLGGRPNDSADGFAGAMQAALADARLEPWDLDAVYAQGLAIP